MQLLAVLVVALALAGCEESTFQAGAGKDAHDRNRGTEGVVAADSAASSPSGSDGTDAGPVASGEGDVFGGDGAASLPSRCDDQSLLILDFKSGWWEGDGGDTFRSLILDEIKLNACPGSTTAGVEYHHIIDPAPAKFFNQDFKNYTQVWVLSGSLDDLADIPLDTPGFVEVLNLIATHKPNLFLGAGFGSVDHANAVAKKVWGTEAFRTENKSGSALLVEDGGSNVIVKTYTKPKVPGSLFQGVSGPIVDHVEVGDMYAGTDELLTNLSGLSILSDCTTPPVISDPFGGSQPVTSRAVPCIGVAQTNGFKVILDSGLPRFYGLYKGEEPTKVYLRNIFRALSL